jgi:hypothetical protein
MARNYRVIVAQTEGGLDAVAGPNWQVIRSTIRQFVELDSDHDHSYGDIGGIEVFEAGFVALASQRAKSP